MLPGMTLVQPGEDTLQAALTAASPGDELVLADGTYTGNVLVINEDITIRAQNAGQAVLDGQGMRRVLYVGSGTVSLEGLDITKGSSIVSACFLNLPGTFFRRPRRKKLP